MGFGGGGGSTTSTTTQKADPWSGIQPQLLQAAGDTQNLYNQGLLKQSYYPGSTVAQLTPDQQQAISLTEQRATKGSPVNNAANSLLTNTLNGGFLNSNPYLDATYNQAAKQVQSTVNGAFGQGGRYGSGLNQQALGNSLDNLATNIYGGDYQNERQFQQQGLLLAPQIANQDYTDIGELANAGSQQQSQNQNNLNDLINRYNFNQQQPQQNIASYLGLLNGTGVGNSTTGTSTTPYFTNPLGNSIGGALGGAAAGGAAIGGGLGLLGSLSDIRAKENIEYIGKENGIPVYKFTYKEDPDHISYIGVMAQDIVESHPEAVSEYKGYYTVDYSKLPVKFRLAETLH